MASVDTTAGKVAWNLLQLGLNPSVQQQLYEEVDGWVQKEGMLVPEMFNRANTPILQAIIRETHRLTPAVFINLIKEVQNAPVELHGVTLSPGSVVAFDSYNPGRNPNWLEHPERFMPERWFSEAVEARKGTPAQTLDHPFFAGPFSQGARRCPGSRVAFLEVQVLLAQLVLDWKLDIAEDIQLQDVESKLETTLVPVWPRIHFESRQ
ncbi:hydroxyvitamin D-1 alpha hydroxylase, mitochondrial [Seminavis robusta]|uniref:Hydroxyvitamin D-1 alpha hydroxylase, mitochondrial n=1 Tax=Seminavis robusta TaxID=568900 RepID=A0A9N8DZJ0_9STRA|nr:hydroxyvitamin D-1 alpha hydroxylase, mitochondrial [Seminavis robusta]|eukprot:Sro477_g150870.1 hydroxyvitamin D-1 alpha hydroxylase, mitochondrial (208) ;mRNA; r:54876-55499